MRFRIDMCDVDLQLKIKEWDAEADSLQWTREEFSLKGKYINYAFDSEVLMCSDVVYLRDALGELLDGSLKEGCSVEFAEPDFVFKLSPAFSAYSEEGKVWFKDGYRDFDIDMEMRVQFWLNDGGLGSNYFSMSFDRGEIQALYTYLRLVMMEIDTADEQVKKLISAGIIIPE